MNELERTAVDGVELEYELRGSGEPVVLIHWGRLQPASCRMPMRDVRGIADQPCLDDYRLQSGTALAGVRRPDDH
ncbi:MAG: hypothetical protein ACRDLA_00365 [Thermoleophilaceae bacterium]